MILRSTIVRPLLPVALLLLCADAWGQPGGDDNLYIPPDLTVALGNQYGSEEIVEVQDYLYSRRTPLLPMIFFDRPGEWNIPERYQQFSGPGDALDYVDTGSVYGWAGNMAKYYEVLNVIGYRMVCDTAATVGLRGCYSFEPGEDDALADERALVVREYLAAVWSIDTTRLPIHPSVRPVDSAANTLHQSEARRVEFLTDLPRILDPVPYTMVTPNASYLALEFAIRPNLDAVDVASIEIRILDGRRELLTAATFAGHPDSSTYHIGGTWLAERRRGEDFFGTLLFEARVITYDGKSRASNMVPLPVRSVEKGMFERWNRGGIPDGHYGLIPFFDPGDTNLDARQKDIIREYVRLQDSVIREEGGPGGVLVVASGYAGMDENPRIDPPLIAAEVDRLRYEYRQQNEFYVRQRERRRIGTLHLTQDFVEDASPTEKEYYLVPGPDMEELERREENRDYRGMTADSIAVIRARHVVSFIRDSLGVPVLNDSLPSDVGSFLINHPYDPVPLQGINIRNEMGDELWLIPEYRFYNRRVELRLGTAREFEERVREVRNQKAARERYELRSTPSGDN